MKGKLILFPVPISEEDHSQQLPTYNLLLLNTCHTFIVEELRTARRFLKRVGYAHEINDTTFLLLNEHTNPNEIGGYLNAIADGANVGLLSEAGLPCVADPGALVTALAQRNGIEVMPLVGPSSLMMALMASGLNGQSFSFAGYLPIDRGQRVAALKRLEDRARQTGETQLFIEAPYRGNQLLETIVGVCKPDTLVCVACDITLPTQFIRTLSVRAWRIERSKVDLHKRNAVFLLGF